MGKACIQRFLHLEYREGATFRVEVEEEEIQVVRTELQVVEVPKVPETIEEVERKKHPPHKYRTQSLGSSFH